MTASKISASQDALQPLEQAFENLCMSERQSNIAMARCPTMSLHPQSGEYVVNQINACPGEHESAGSNMLTYENYQGVSSQTTCFQWMLRLFITLGPTARSAEQYQMLATDLPLGKLKDVSIQSSPVRPDS